SSGAPLGGGGALGGGALGGGALGGGAMTGAAPPSVSRPTLTTADGRGTAGADARNVLPDISAGGARPAGAAAGASLLPGVRITADAVNNTLLIYANQESYR